MLIPFSLLAAEDGPNELNQSLQWQSHHREHPWSVKVVPKPAPEPNSVLEMAQAAFVLIGERHDNPDHHILQGRIVAQLRREKWFFVSTKMTRQTCLPCRRQCHIRSRMGQSGWPL